MRGQADRMPRRRVRFMHFVRSAKRTRLSVYAHRGVADGDQVRYVRAEIRHKARLRREIIVAYDGVFNGDHPRYDVSGKRCPVDARLSFKKARRFY